MTAPSVAALTHRLASCPDDFLAEPLTGVGGVVSVAGVLGDVLRPLGHELPPSWVESLSPARTDEISARWLRATLITSWLAADPTLAGHLSAATLLGFLSGDLHRMTGLVKPQQLVADPDRREELVRLLLRAADVIPDGETEAQAADRLSTLDSVARTRVEAEARAAEERAREVRAAMERQRAEEAAARASRE